MRPKAYELGYRLWETLTRIHKGPAGATALVLAASSPALAQSIGQRLTQEFSEALCPVAQFLVGPLAWAAIFAAFAIGIIVLALGGRGAIRWMIVAFAAAILMVAGKAWFGGQGSSTVTSCAKL